VTTFKTNKLQIKNIFQKKKKDIFLVFVIEKENKKTKTKKKKKIIYTQISLE